MNQAEDDNELPFMDHLIELRSRLMKALAVVLVVFLGLLPFANRLYHFFAGPLLSKLPEGNQMIAIEVASPFLIPMKLAFFVALLISMPVLIYQLWAFVAPGLYRNEKSLAAPLLISAILLFYLGCAFAFFLVLPTVFGFLHSVAPVGVAVMTDIGKYLDFVLVIFFAFGVCFEVPVAVVILTLLGWVNPKQLAEARSYVVVIAFIIAAVLTPPDVVSQLMLAIPMIVLYEVGLLAARWLPRRAKAKAEAT
ncbi:MAG: twin-arginine translocase subunit TatC [Lysobacterales bacterium CG02_land_8_20_14_3_00_62_12]|nr:MAG: twin-arginine translocase subunit TatC [Xanthomonadales bacterium CG02_land_8_20_14_3_00_62_12]PJA42420.1 MAG: twin-arginine translocase subunit TatC [Xanthomonadales bacterium CG_4_9_14_3_um_filter_62_6]